MGNAKEPSITVSEPQPAVIALYVRDVAGLPVAADIPPLSPPVSPGIIDLGFDLSEACVEWGQWWDEIMFYEERQRHGAAGGFPSLPEPSRFPVLGQLFTELEQDALSYSVARKREAAALRSENVLNRVQFKILSEARPGLLRGLRAREVSLHVTQLPLEGEFRQSRSEHHVVVSLDTYRDPAAYDAALRDALGWRR